jgi:protease-4
MAEEKDKDQVDVDLEPGIEKIHRGIESEVIVEYLKEQKMERRWKTIRRIFISVMILCGLMLYAGTLAGSLGYRMLPTKEAVAVVPISGVIAKNTEASATSVITVLERLFSNENVKGIILLIDSGGGSPTEAERITRFLDDAKERTGKPVIAACSSMCASAAYMIAIHADKIYAGEYSWAGSIGAIMKGWDFRALMDRFDVDQRVFASGPLKDLMNPFSDMSPEMSKKLAGLVNETADTFIAEVKDRRGGKLSDTPELFTGAVWTGRTSLELGLIDDIGTVETILEDDFDGLPGTSYYPKRRGNTLFDRVLGSVGEGIGRAIIGEANRVEL